MQYGMILLCLVTVGSAQHSLNESVESSLETILERSGGEEDVVLRGEELEYLRQHPVNVVKPSFGELLRIPFVSPLLAESIILFTDTVEVTEIEQLRDAALMSPILFGRIAPFITVDDPRSHGMWGYFIPDKVEFRSRFEQRMQRSRGFEEQKYAGSPRSIYQRIRGENSIVEGGVMVEKDAGELFQDRFTARFAEIKNIGFLKQLIIGNFSAGAAQGLVLAPSQSASKGADAAGQVRRRGNFINPSFSTAEFRYFDGAAVRIDIDRMTVTGMYSARKLPASMDSLGIVSSFYTSGLYRNSHETKYRNTLSEKVLAGTVEYNFTKDIKLQATGLSVAYGSILDPSLFHSNGRQRLSAGSAAWEANISPIRSFGEVATNDGTRYNSVAGIMVPIGKTLFLSYLHRTYHQGYAALFARPFGERSDIGAGETGNYVGLELNYPATVFSAYVDQFSFPHSKGWFGTEGSESFFQIIRDISKQTELLFQLRHSHRIEEVEEGRTGYRLGLTVRFNKNWELMQRMDVVDYYSVTTGTSKYSERGFLGVFDCLYRSRESRLSIRSRMAWFRTPSYNTRLYQYEPDLPGNFTNPPLYGVGIRWFLLAKYEFLNQCSIGLKYSETKKPFVDVLGSGNEQIDGNLDAYITLQADFRF
jgi:hypothetical protein